MAKVNRSQFYGKEYNQILIDMELGKFTAPFTDGVIEYLVPTKGGMQIKRVRVDEEQWNTMKQAPALLNMVLK